MIAGRLSEDPGTMQDSPAFGILGCKTKRLHSGERDRSGAHCAGLEGYPQGALVKPRAAKLRRRGADRDHLGMGRGIASPAHRISRFGNRLIAAGYDSPHRNFSLGRSLARQFERPAHRSWKRKGHVQRGASRARRSSHIELFEAASAWLCPGF